jgi:hypothetical protein
VWDESTSKKKKRTTSNLKQNARKRKVLWRVNGSVHKHRDRDKPTLHTLRERGNKQNDRIRENKKENTVCRRNPVGIHFRNVEVKYTGFRQRSDLKPMHVVK